MRPWESFPVLLHLAKRIINLKIEKGRILCPLEADLGRAKMKNPQSNSSPSRLFLSKLAGVKGAVPGDLSWCSVQEMNAGLNLG